MLVTSATDFGDCYFMPYSVKIFNAYLKAHLAPPDGTRNDDDIDKEVTLEHSPLQTIVIKREPLTFLKFLFA